MSALRERSARRPRLTMQLPAHGATPTARSPIIPLATAILDILEQIVSAGAMIILLLIVIALAQSTDAT